METAIAKLVNPRVNTIVPNVNWGLGLSHECDMLVLDEKNRLTEIEIKISASDLRADFKKGHGHISKMISRLVYAVPEKLLELAENICPKYAGIIVVRWNEIGIYTASWHRQCKHNKMIKPIDDKTVRKLLELGCMRIWSLKQVLHTKQLKRIQTPVSAD